LVNAVYFWLSWRNSKEATFCLPLFIINYLALMLLAILGIVWGSFLEVPLCNCRLSSLAFYISWYISQSSYVGCLTQVLAKNLKQISKNSSLEPKEWVKLDYILKLLGNPLHPVTLTCPPKTYWKYHLSS